MIDTEALNKQLAATVRQAVVDQANRLRTEIDQNELVTSILCKPVMNFPEDVIAVLGTSKSTAYELAKADDWPAMSEIARKRYVRTDAFLSWMDGRTK
ncbi:helix-turn-helix domain-containing protein [Ruegeria arenilitoris]|uniref:helix-turn-helix domain-containing protein n=1 Tax=Ruegeria arenilitoris TaxID=1173585 RepID=UPI0014810700|nr:helix-turn-helix domain-containing protein [Ruegeria arenilitoris]